jgi:hypothetical protein
MHLQRGQHLHPAYDVTLYDVIVPLQVEDRAMMPDGSFLLAVFSRASRGADDVFRNSAAFYEVQEQEASTPSENGAAGAPVGFMRQGDSTMIDVGEDALVSLRLKPITESTAPTSPLDRTALTVAGATAPLAILHVSPSTSPLSSTANSPLSPSHQPEERQPNHLIYSPEQHTHVAETELLGGTVAAAASPTDNSIIADHDEWKTPHTERLLREASPTRRRPVDEWYAQNQSSVSNIHQHHQNNADAEESIHDDDGTAQPEASEYDALDLTRSDEENEMSLDSLNFDPTLLAPNRSTALTPSNTQHSTSINQHRHPDINLQDGMLDLTRLSGSISSSEDGESNAPLGAWAKPTARSATAAEEQPSPAPMPYAVDRHPARSVDAEKLHLSFFTSSAGSAIAFSGSDVGSDSTVVSRSTPAVVDAASNVMQAEIDSLHRQLTHAHRLLQSRSMSRCEVGTQTERTTIATTSATSATSATETADGGSTRMRGAGRSGLDDTLAWEVSPAAVTPPLCATSAVVHLHHESLETMLRAVEPASSLTDDCVANAAVAHYHSLTLLDSSVGSARSNSTNTSQDSTSARESAFESAKETPSPPRTLVRKVTKVASDAGPSAPSEEPQHFHHHQPHLQQQYQHEHQHQPLVGAVDASRLLARAEAHTVHGAGSLEVEDGGSNNEAATPTAASSASSPERSAFTGDADADGEAWSASLTASLASTLDTSACNKRAELIMQKYLGDDCDLSNSFTCADYDFDNGTTRGR